MGKIIVYFEMAEDNFTVSHFASYDYGTSNAEIITDLEHSFGEINVLGYETI